MTEKENIIVIHNDQNNGLVPHNAIVYFKDGAIFKGNIENYSFVGFGIFDYDVTIRGYYQPSY